MACPMVHIRVRVIGLDSAVLALHSDNTATEKFKAQGMDIEDHGSLGLTHTAHIQGRAVLSKDRLDDVTRVEQPPFN